MSTRATPAIDALRRAGVTYVVHEAVPGERQGRARDDRPNYGLDAAVALGVEPERVLKTLIALVDGERLAVAVLPTTCDLDLKAFAAALGGRRAELAEPAAAERATGYVVGGISPIGQRRRLPIVLDEAALGHDTVFVSAGRRGLHLEMSARDLARLAGAVVSPICRESDR